MLNINVSAEQLKKKARYDLSVKSLVISNLIVIIFALWENWNIGVLLWIYWGQSVIIGFFNFIKMLTLKNFSTKEMRVSGRKVEPTRTLQVNISLFFLFHYGGFHFGYLIFITALYGIERALSLDVFACMLIFFINHAVSFSYNWRNERHIKQHIGKVMMYPYARIVPMHLTIIFAAILSRFHATLPFFMALKTIADVIMHMHEHARSKKSDSPLKILKSKEEMIIHKGDDAVKKGPDL